MNKLILFFSLTIGQLVFTKSIAQCNLVPNSGFENITNCTTGWGGLWLGNAPPWDSPEDGNPDLFNNCIPQSDGTSAPQNDYGFQYPHSGNGYTNVVTLNPVYNDKREYIQVELDSSLIANVQYCISFYVSPAGVTGMATNNIGMYISNTHTFVNGNANLNFIPQINSINVISDTLNWTEITGTYIAQGGERYIIIGNFFADSLTDTVPIQTIVPWHQHSGFYFLMKKLWYICEVILKTKRK